MAVMFPAHVKCLKKTMLKTQLPGISDALQMLFNITELQFMK